MKYDKLMEKLGAFETVENMTSANGNDVPNQFIIYFENGTVFQSYSSIIAVQVSEKDGDFWDRKTYIGSDWDYSVTTGKYRNRFLGEGKNKTREKIDNGTYKLIKE